MRRLSLKRGTHEYLFIITTGFFFYLSGNVFYLDKCISILQSFECSFYIMLITIQIRSCIIIFFKYVDALFSVILGFYDICSFIVWDLLSEICSSFFRPAEEHLYPKRSFYFWYLERLTCICILLCKILESNIRLQARYCFVFFAM